jgi:hypothetical protein
MGNLRRDKLTDRQKEIIKRFNDLNYCNAINNINLDTVKIYSGSDGDKGYVRTMIVIAGSIKFLSGPEAYSSGYRFNVQVKKPIDEVREMLKNKDPELMSKISEIIRIHNFKKGFNCNGPVKNFDEQIKNLIDEYNEINICKIFNDFKLSDLKIFKLSDNKSSQAHIYLSKWNYDGESSKDAKSGYIKSFRIPISLEELKEKIDNNDEALFRKIKRGLEIEMERLQLNCDGPVTNDAVSKPESNPIPNNGPLDKSVSHTGPKDVSINYQLTPKDNVNENIIRIKKIMY